MAQASTPALGALYCQTLGRSWQLNAETFLGKYNQAGDWWTGPLARTQQTATNVVTNFRLLDAGVRAATAGSRAMHHAQALEESQMQQQETEKADTAAANAEDAARKDPNQAEAQLSQALNQSLPAFLKLAWTMNQGIFNRLSSARAQSSLMMPLCQFRIGLFVHVLSVFLAKFLARLGKQLYRMPGKSFSRPARKRFNSNWRLLP